MTIRLRIQHDEPHATRAVELLLHDTARRHTGVARVLRPGESAEVHVHANQCVTVSECPMPGDASVAALPRRAAGAE